MLSRFAVVLVLLAAMPFPASAQQPVLPPLPWVRIKIINAKTNLPVQDEKLNVALKSDQIGSVAMATDKNGYIDVDTSKASIIRILSNFYAYKMELIFAI